MMTGGGGAQRRRELYVNTVVAWTWGQAALLTSVLALPVLTRLLPKPEFGLWTQLLALSALADIADFGMSSVFLRRMAGPHASGVRSLGKGVSQFYGASSAVLAAVLLAVCLVPGGLVAPFEGKAHVPQLTALVIIAPIVVNLACQPYAIRLMSRGRLDIAQTFGAGPAVVGTLATIVAAYLVHTAFGVGVAYALIEIAFDVALILVARRMPVLASETVASDRGPSLALWKDMVRESWGVLIIELTPQLMLIVDSAIISHIVSASAVAIFAVAVRAADLLRRFFTPLTQSLFVSLCRATGADRYRVGRYAASLSWVIIPSGLALGCLVAAVGGHALAFVFGRGYGRAEGPLAVMIAVATLRAMYMPGVRRIQADGALGTLPRWFLVGFVTHIGVAILLTIGWSVIGAAVAVLVSSVVCEAAPSTWGLRQHLRERHVESHLPVTQMAVSVLGGAGLLALTWLRINVSSVIAVPSGILAVTLGIVAANGLYKYLRSARSAIIG